MSQAIRGYDVGALLYCPANAHHTIAQSVAAERLPRPFSLALCLEDTVRADALAAAEQAVEQTLRDLTHAARQETFYRPLTFVRVRSPEQLARLGRTFGKYRPLLTGFILPKFFIETCGAYCAVIRDLQAEGLDYFYMPVFEAPSMVPLHTRHQYLAEIKAQLDELRDCILNIRVGGNDLCHVFGLRRDPGHTIYDLRPVADVLTDLLTTFAPDYLVAGPVWEYYTGPGWAEGLARECELDRLNGFVGKTVIHPKQIPIVNESLQVSPADYADAKNILAWDDPCLVAPSAEGTRMNEYQTHFRWARRVVALGERYGVRRSRMI